MKIAVATQDNNVSMHFGRCDGYTIYEVIEAEIKSEHFESAPQHQPGMMPGWLKEKGADVVIAGGAGARAQQLFERMNIKLVLGVTGSPGEAAEKYLEGKLKSGASTCENRGICDH